MALTHVFLQLCLKHLINGNLNSSFYLCFLPYSYCLLFIKK